MISRDKRRFRLMHEGCNPRGEAFGSTASGWEDNSNVFHRNVAGFAPVNAGTSDAEL